ncbi:MAG: hypothetical protein ACR2NA_00605 [Solirubrobacterales bacterium]
MISERISRATRSGLGVSSGAVCWRGEGGRIRTFAARLDELGGRRRVAGSSDLRIRARRAGRAVPIFPCRLGDRIGRGKGRAVVV